MRRLAAALLASALSIAPAVAQDWGTYFNMATFGAGGGSEAGGSLNFECAGSDSGFATAGQAYITLRVKSGVELNKKSLDRGLAFWVGDEQSYDLPMQLDPGSTDTLSYVYSPASTPTVIAFIAALRQGSRFNALLGIEMDNIARIELDGSNAALDAIAACVAGET